MSQDRNHPRRWRGPSMPRTRSGRSTLALGALTITGGDLHQRGWTIAPVAKLPHDSQAAAQRNSAAE